MTCLDCRENENAARKLGWNGLPDVHPGAHGDAVDWMRREIVNLRVISNKVPAMVARVHELEDRAAEHQRAIVALAEEYNRRDEDRKHLQQRVDTLLRERDEARHDVATATLLRDRDEAVSRTMQDRERSEWRQEQDALARSRGSR